MSNTSGNVTWLEWLTVPLTFLFTNIFEWAVHRFIMHRPVNIKGLRAIYERHTLNHHQFFTDEEMRFRDTKDWRVTVFPPYALVVFILMSIPVAVALGLLLTPNVGWLFMCVTTGMYLIYEFMHFCCHVDENWFVRHGRNSEISCSLWRPSWLSPCGFFQKPAAKSERLKAINYAGASPS
jgi:hypothetical protein